MTAPGERSVAGIAPGAKKNMRIVLVFDIS